MNFPFTTQAITTVDQFKTLSISDQTPNDQKIITVIDSMQGNVEQLYAALMYLCGDNNQSGIDKFIELMNSAHSHIAGTLPYGCENYQAACREISQKVYKYLCHHLPLNEQQDLLHITSQFMECQSDVEFTAVKTSVLTHLQGEGPAIRFQSALNSASDINFRQMIAMREASNNISSLQLTKNNLNNNFILLHSHTDLGLINLITRNANG